MVNGIKKKLSITNTTCHYVLCGGELIKLLFYLPSVQVFVSWNSHKGAYHLVNSNDVVDIGKHGHISLLIYPTDLGE